MQLQSLLHAEMVQVLEMPFHEDYTFIQEDSMAADDLVVQGAKESIAMVLTWFSQLILALAHKYSSLND